MFTQQFIIQMSTTTTHSYLFRYDFLGREHIEGVFNSWAEAYSSMNDWMRANSFQPYPEVLPPCFQPKGLCMFDCRPVGNFSEIS